MIDENTFFLARLVYATINLPSGDSCLLGVSFRVSVAESVRAKNIVGVFPNSCVNSHQATVRL